MGGRVLTGERGFAVRTLTDLQRWAGEAPEGTTISVAALARLLENLQPEDHRPESPPLQTMEPAPESWRSRLWDVPAETRLCVDEVAEAVGRSRHWVYRASSAGRGRDRLPARKLDSRLEFTAGELRAWIRNQEEVLHRGPYLLVEPRRAG